MPSSTLQRGIAKARKQISGVIHELLVARRDGYEVTGIEIAASFNADERYGRRRFAVRLGSGVRPYREDPDEVPKMPERT